MKKLIFILCFLIPYLSHSQCTGQQSFTVNPQPINGTFNPGQVVTFCYTMVGYNEVATNWIEGFDINFGSGWINPTPVSSPNNCGGGGGSWVWRNTVTASATGSQFGPGYFFDLNGDGNPGNDFGDQNTANCTWSFCFSVQVNPQSCSPQSLYLGVIPGGDGTMGSWINNSCGLTPFVIFNGNINPLNPIQIGPINHN